MPAILGTAGILGVLLNRSNKHDLLCCDVVHAGQMDAYGFTEETESGTALIDFCRRQISAFVKAVEVVSPERGRIDEMRPDNGVPLSIWKLNLRMSLQF